MRKIYHSRILPALRNIKTVKFFLFSLLVFGTLDQFSIPQQLDEKSWGPDSSVVNSQYLDDTIRQKYVSYEDEDTDSSVSKRPGDLFSVYIPGHSTLPVINLNFETYFNSINSFNYILSCEFSSPRSPPLFS
jgi:hypothetical protein